MSQRVPFLRPQLLPRNGKFPGEIRPAGDLEVPDTYTGTRAEYAREKAGFTGNDEDLAAKFGTGSAKPGDTTLATATPTAATTLGMTPTTNLGLTINTPAAATPPAVTPPAATPTGLAAVPTWAWGVGGAVLVVGVGAVAYAVATKDSASAEEDEEDVEAQRARIRARMAEMQRMRNSRR